MRVKWWACGSLAPPSLFFSLCFFFIFLSLFRSLCSMSFFIFSFFIKSFFFYVSLFLCFCLFTSFLSISLLPFFLFFIISYFFYIFLTRPLYHSNSSSGVWESGCGPVGVRHHHLCLHDPGHSAALLSGDLLMGQFTLLHVLFVWFMMWWC